MNFAYVNRKTTKLYEGASGGSQSMVLIYGDEVEATGPPQPAGAPTTAQRTPVTFRRHPGFIKTGHLSDSPALEMYFIDVGQGDSTFIVTPERKKILIDGGANNRALGFLAWKYRLDRPDSDPVTIDLMAVSHADADHLKGLTPVLTHPKIRVRQIVHNGIALYSGADFAHKCGNLDAEKNWLITLHDRIDELNRDELHEDFRTWFDAVTQTNTPYRSVMRGDAPIDLGDASVSLEILGPLRGEFDNEPALAWFGDHAHTINGHSVVLRLQHGDISLLLSGDINIEGSKHLLGELDIGDSMNAHILKVPHHGSHEFYPPFLVAVNPQISVISSGDNPDHGHPRAVLLGAIGAASRSHSPLLFSTEIAATFFEVNATDSPNEETLDALDTAAPDADDRARRLFKRRLHGMINVRSSGRQMYAARRVATGYWWESYGPLAPAERSQANR
jgi:hypothetical protein